MSRCSLSMASIGFPGRSLVVRCGRWNGRSPAGNIRHGGDLENPRSPGQALNYLAEVLLGGVLTVTALSVTLRLQLTRIAEHHAGNRASRHAMQVTATFGVLLGVLVPITSVGGAALAMPVLLLLYPRTRPARLIGADIAHAVPLTLVAGAGHLLVATVVWNLLSSLAAGSIPGVLLGGLLAGRAPEAVFRYVLSAAPLVVGYKLLT
jgi:uncharacterized membrane protein YfcA